MINNKPIGIFDSGLGGLTVMSEIIKILPLENFVYFGDTAHIPYGSKSKDVIIKYSKEIIFFLMKHKVKLIVVACNTASAFILPILQKNFKISIPVVEMIKSSIKAALVTSKNKKIGIIGTEGTINSGIYLKEINKISKCKIYQQACPLFVPLIEEGLNKGSIVDSVVKKYINPILRKKIDTLILGCTHYPILKKALSKNLGKNIKLINSAKTTAKEVKNTLNKMNILASKKCKKNKFFVSDNPEKFQRVGNYFFSKKILNLNVKKIEIKR
ncbi:MAG: glutamate racemase [Endomicrobium sp.]|jgi:glutamate racemase|nr:glutamate racemase [Endomicrobium sp.]